MGPEGLTGRNVPIRPQERKGLLDIMNIQKCKCCQVIQVLMGFQECKDQGNPGPVGFKVDNGNAKQTGP